MRLVRKGGPMPYIEIRGEIIRSFIPHSLCTKEKDELYNCFMRYDDKWMFMNFYDMNHIESGPKRFHIINEGRKSTMRDMFMDMTTYEWPMWGMAFYHARDFSEVEVGDKKVSVATVCVTIDDYKEKWFYINSNGDFCGRYYPIGGALGTDRNGSPVDVNKDNKTLQQICRDRWTSMEDVIKNSI